MTSGTWQQAGNCFFQLIFWLIFYIFSHVAVNLKYFIDTQAKCRHCFLWGNNLMSSKEFIKAGRVNLRLIVSTVKNCFKKSCYYCTSNILNESLSQPWEVWWEYSWAGPSSLLSCRAMGWRKTSSSSAWEKTDINFVNKVMEIKKAELCALCCKNSCKLIMEDLYWLWFCFLLYLH